MKSDLLKSFQEHEQGRLIYPDGGNQISYCGPITQEFIDTVVLLIESKFKNEWKDSKKNKKLMAVMIELLQNIYHHSKKMTGLFEDMQLDSALCIIEKLEDDIFKLYTGNFMESSKISDFRSRITEVNELKDDQLKDYYRKKLAHSELSDKGGAGLGIIEIARKASKKIEFEFENITDNFAFLTLGVTV